MTADIFTNRMGDVLVIAPAPKGKLSSLCLERNVVFQREKGIMEKGITRWIFANIDHGTLTDDWGNPFDHQAHNLIAGTLEEGLHLLTTLADSGLRIQDAPSLFVPLQTLKSKDLQSSDNLRKHHPRAFALAHRTSPQLSSILTAARDSLLG
jgi:hypothetical protein